MKYKILTMPKAKRDIQNIVLYLSRYYVSTVLRFTNKLKAQTQRLANMPYMYPPYEKDTYFRRMVIDDYLLFYHVDEESHIVIVHHVFHSSKNVSADILNT